MPTKEQIESHKKWLTAFRTELEKGIVLNAVASIIPLNLSKSQALQQIQKQIEDSYSNPEQIQRLCELGNALYERQELWLKDVKLSGLSQKSKVVLSKWQPLPPPESLVQWPTQRMEQLKNDAYLDPGRVELDQMNKADRFPILLTAARLEQRTGATKTMAVAHKECYEQIASGKPGLRPGSTGRAMMETSLGPGFTYNVSKFASPTKTEVEVGIRTGWSASIDERLPPAIQVMGHEYIHHYVNAIIVCLYELRQANEDEDDIILASYVNRKLTEWIKNGASNKLGYTLKASVQLQPGQEREGCSEYASTKASDFLAESGVQTLLSMPEQWNALNRAAFDFLFAKTPDEIAKELNEEINKKTGVRGL